MKTVTVEIKTTVTVEVERNASKETIEHAAWQYLLEFDNDAPTGTEFTVKK